MTSPILPAIILVLGLCASLLFATLTYALRDFSRSKLADYLGEHNGDRYFEILTDRADRHIMLTAILRQCANLVVWSSLYFLFDAPTHGFLLRIAAPLALSLAATVFFSVALPNAVANYAAEPIIGFMAPAIILLDQLLRPVAAAGVGIDLVVKRLMGVKARVEPEEFEQEILSAVEEGEKEGVVDEQERELIENVIEFRDTAAGYVMTERSEIVALNVDADIEQVRSVFERSGHSRVLVIDGSLDKVVGFLYARDLIKSLGLSSEGFDIKPQVRPAMFIPETTPLRNLLKDFRQAKVHVAVVLDEYGGTAGLITIEDILEELVGEIADEHEPVEPEMIRKSGDNSAEVDARLPIEEFNKHMQFNLPEDAGYETVGGFLSNSVGRIPMRGTTYEFQGAKFTVLDAEPQRLIRVKVDVLSRTNAIPAVSGRTVTVAEQVLR